LTLATGATVTAILDQDNLSSNSDTALATQQSIKAYVDSTVGAASNVSDTGIVFDGSTTGDSVTTTLAITDPTSNRIFTFADESGTVSTQAFANGAAVALAIALG
jgi:DNA gyrase/topoisomerase IV subunit B